MRVYEGTNTLRGIGYVSYLDEDEQVSRLPGVFNHGRVNMSSL